jgi:hypothetical protein
MAGHDLRSPAAQIVAALKDALLRLLTQDEVEIQIHNRKVVFRSPAEVQQMLEKWEPIAAAEEGRGVITTIPVRFK